MIFPGECVEEIPWNTILLKVKNGEFQMVNADRYSIIDYNISDDNFLAETNQVNDGMRVRTSPKRHMSARTDTACV